MAPELYEIVIDPLPQEDGGGFVATVTELRGCMSNGATQEEALANVKDAMAAWLATAAKMGRAIPAPKRVYA
jgi:predicted RNase H-like HicB family nuclease